MLFGKHCENKNKADFVTEAKVKEQPSKAIIKSENIIKKLKEPLEVPIAFQPSKEIAKFAIEKKLFPTDRRQQQP
jgi:flagellin-specific chaperone FliS